MMGNNTNLGKMISVIVPVYNCEKYIGRCVESIINQTYRKLEILVINDGSTDGTEYIIEKYKKIDSRIKYIKHSNRGVAYTRKKGIEEAVGEYVVFVDADDYLELDYLESMVQFAGNNDIITTGYYKEYEGYSSTALFDKIPTAEYVGPDKIRYIINNMICMEGRNERGLTGVIWNKLFRTYICKKICNKINDKIWFGEDSQFLYMYMLECSSICVTHICGYHYIMRQDSIVHSVNENYLQNLSELYISLKHRFMQSEYSESLIFQLERWTVSLLSESTRMMGFHEENQILQYMFPYTTTVEGKNVAIYGAGVVGQNYYRQLKKICTSLLWVDKKPLLSDVKPVSALLEQDFQYLVIAVKREEMVDSIINELLDMGINKEILIWGKPIEII